MVGIQYQGHWCLFAGKNVNKQKNSVVSCATSWIEIFGDFSSESEDHNKSLEHPQKAISNESVSSAHKLIILWIIDFTNFTITSNEHSKTCRIVSEKSTPFDCQLFKIFNYSLNITTTRFTNSFISPAISTANKTMWNEIFKRKFACAYMPLVFSLSN